MTLNRDQVTEIVRERLLPAFQKEKERLDRIDRWYRWEHDDPYAPRQSTREYRMLQSKSKTPWLGLVVTTVAQQLYVDGYRAGNTSENASSWDDWQRNRMDQRQIPVHRATLGYGLSYVKVFPGEPTPVIRGVSPRRMIALYADVVEDEYPMYTLQVDPSGDKQMYQFVDDESIHFLTGDKSGESVEWIESREHGTGVCPVVRFADQMDLDGRSPGQVEPFIPVAARIDQTTFDRMIVQRFASWKIRTISGMAQPDDEEERNRKKLQLRVEDLLIADDPDTKFGTLPETPLEGFIRAKDADIRDLAAVSQTPPNNLLGEMVNLSAEALAAAEAALTRKVEERKIGLGESWEQVLQLSAFQRGDMEAAEDFKAQVRWRDMESRSLAQTADALGKLAQMLRVPVQMLWERIPGFTDQDVEEAIRLQKENPDAMQQIANSVTRGMGSIDPAADANV